MDDDQFYRISKAISDPTRFVMLEKIAKVTELACSELTSDMPVSAPTISHHVKELQNAGLLDIRRDSKFMYMKVRREVWRKYLHRLRGL